MSELPCTNLRYGSKKDPVETFGKYPYGFTLDWFVNKGHVPTGYEFAQTSESHLTTALDIGENKVPEAWTRYVNNVKQNGISALRPMSNSGPVSLYNVPVFRNGGIPIFVTNDLRTIDGKYVYKRVGFGPKGLVSEEVGGFDTPEAQEGHTYILKRTTPRDPKKKRSF